MERPTRRTQGFAGDGGPAMDAELSQPEAVAVDPAGTVLYIADYGDSHCAESI